MYIIVGLETIAIVGIVILLILAALGLTIIASIKQLLFIACAGLALLSLLYIFCAAFESSLSRFRIFVLPILLQLITIIFCIGIPWSVVKNVNYQNGNIFLWWAAVLVILSILCFLISLALWEEINNKKLIVIIYILSLVIFVVTCITKLWIMGAKYNRYLESNKLGCALSYIVEADEVTMYKNRKRFEEKNEIIGTYPKGTVLKVKEPFILGKLEDGNWASTYSISYGWSLIGGKGEAPEGALKAFQGKFIAPDGKIGYIAIFNDSFGYDCIVEYEQPTKAEAYENHRPRIIMKVAKYLFYNYDLFGYKSYEPPVQTQITKD